MNKSTLLAAAVAATLVSAPSFAGFYCGTDSLTGYVKFTNFADKNPLQFNATMYDMDGTINCQVPPSGNYGIEILSGKLELDMDMDDTYEHVVSLPDPLALFAGALNISGLTPNTYIFDFTPGIDGPNTDALPDHLVPFGFTVDYDGTSPGVMNLLNSLLGAPVFNDPTGKGTLDIAGHVGTDGLTMTFTESNLEWVGFGYVLAGLDAAFGPNTPNEIDGNFRLTNVSVHIPEPASIALLGLGLLGLAAARRRRAA